MRIALVNDMPVALEALRSVLSSDPGFRIAWTAANGAEAVQMASVDKPDLIVMDLVMPVLDGVEATRQIMIANPCPIVIVTESVDTSSEAVYRAFQAGAIDVVRTPVLHGTRAGMDASALLFKIRKLTEIPLGKGEQIAVAGAGSPAKFAAKPTLLAVGASAGGPSALVEILREFPKNCSASILIVQHLDQRFAKGLAQFLEHEIVLPVRLAHDHDVPTAGTVLIAGRDLHLVVRPEEDIGYSATPANLAYQPSIDVFFQSVAAHWRGRAIGMLLTGMGSDGAAGLKVMRDAGHHTIAQDSASCAVSAMPRAAQKLGAAAQILPLRQIAPAILAHLRSQTPQ